MDLAEWRFTAADLAALPSELPSGPVRFELDNGRLVTMAPRKASQHALVLRIAAALFHCGEQQGYGKTRCGDVRIVLWRDPDRVVGTSVAFLGRDSLPAQETPNGYLQTIPALVVDVAGEDDAADYVERKISDLLAAGVSQVVIADATEKSFTVHSPGSPPRRVREGQTLRIDDLIPGFELNPSEVFLD